ncbi:hypothetical protein KFE25_009030 [Diacronema lutheri]|uniref:Uncharacterized protein n=2 Tax=Diacronema lutheri TaxID=2081491 RepID=A0A8J5XU39_DIALT|nr:hypothetical protein KFE25_009030 [Diacronema lutheri]
MFASSASGEVVNCEKVAAACLAASAIPDDFTGLDADALEQVIGTLTRQLQVAQRVLQAKQGAKAEAEPEPMRHNDSFAINQERLPLKSKVQAEPAFKHVNSMEINRQRMAEGQGRYAAIAMGAAVALAAAFFIGRRSR